MSLAESADGPDLPFDRLVAPYQPALLAHCYRMTGSLHDAQDALQETLLRAWRGLDACSTSGPAGAAGRPGAAGGTRGTAAVPRSRTASG